MRTVLTERKHTRKSNAPRRGKRWVRRLKRSVWTMVLVMIVLPLSYVYIVSIDLFGLFGGMPSYAAIENPKNDLSSELISADGVSLGRYFRYLSNRSQVSYDELSPFLVKTLILSEDHRFNTHAGMDFWAYPRVLWGVLTFQNAGGGSTITQQLAKNLYTLNPELDGKLASMSPTIRRVIQKTK